MLTSKVYFTCIYFLDRNGLKILIYVPIQCNKKRGIVFYSWKLYQMHLKENMLRDLFSLPVEVTEINLIRSHCP
jgi:hypothetical protein